MSLLYKYSFFKKYFVYSVPMNGGRGYGSLSFLSRKNTWLGFPVQLPLPPGSFQKGGGNPNVFDLGVWVAVAVREYLSLSCFGDWWQYFCGLIMCIECFRLFITRHKTIWCLSKTIEDGVSLRFFSVDLSRRKAVLLRGGPRWKGLGGISRAHVPFCTTSPLALWIFLRLTVSLQNDGLLVLLFTGSQ